MTLSRNKLYSIMLIACVAGYAWFYYNMTQMTGNTPVSVCLIKHFTNIPCPSCGSTRAVIALTKGNFIEALSINPMGIPVAIIMFTTPLWIMIDIVTRSQTLFNFYLKVEAFLKKPKYAIPLILLVIINWIWNISKGL